MSEHTFTTRLSLKQETIDGPVELGLVSIPRVSPHTPPVPEGYQVLASMYTAMQVNLIQEDIALADTLENPNYNVEIVMAQDEIGGEIFTSLSLDPVHIEEEEAPVIYGLASSMIMQLLEGLGMVDEDGNLTSDALEFELAKRGTIH